MSKRKKADKVVAGGVPGAADDIPVGCPRCGEPTRVLVEDSDIQFQCCELVSQGGPNDALEFAERPPMNPTEFHTLSALVHFRCAYILEGDPVLRRDIARAVGVIVQRHPDPKLVAAVLIHELRPEQARRFIGAVATEANLSPDNQELFYSVVGPASDEAPW